MKRASGSLPKLPVFSPRQHPRHAHTTSQKVPKMIDVAAPEVQTFQSTGFVFEQRVEWLEAVQVIAGDWNRPGQNISHRSLILQRWDDPERTNSLSKRWRITIAGSPNRGSIIVPECLGDCVRLSTDLRKNTVFSIADDKEVCRSIYRMLCDMRRAISESEVTQ